MSTNQTWVLRARPVGDVKDSDLELVESPLGGLADGHVRVKTIYLSLDPTNRIWMSDADAYLPPVEIGEGMRGGSIGVVIESRYDKVSEGAIVNTGLSHWARYNDISGSMVNVLPAIPGLPLTAFMGPLGATGMTAYFGLTDIGKPKAGDTLVVSAAAGAVGSMVGQIGKIHGCRVVGIAGADDKCQWLTEKAGFDAAINYKTEDVGKALDVHCPDGIDINFENVGGEIMDAVIARLNDFSRMPLCGLISSYNDTDATPGPYSFANLLMRRTLLKGFIILDYLDRFPEGMEAMASWLMEGKICFETDVVEGLENAPASLERLFTGKNLGKLVVRVSEEP
ncbi:NADP-dependent oxidoreductase [Congregibacter sp.]|uniref:NADP-dependent oxidoreductase n=1 Tax=Congregibacter sp. TaxID=2744308 RepID=UPI003F6D1F53